MKNTILLLIAAVALSACSKSVNGVQNIPTVPTGGGGIGALPIGTPKVAVTYDHVFYKSGSRAGVVTQEFMITDAVLNPNGRIEVTLPENIFDGCTGEDGESCSTSAFDNPLSSLNFRGATGKVCSYYLVGGSQLRYQAQEVACVLELDPIHPTISVNVQGETSLTFTLVFEQYDR